MNTQAQDLDLIGLVAQGSERAMQQIYDKYYLPVRNFSRRRLIDAEAQDDVVQETMLNVWKYAKDFRGESKLSSWIFAIAARSAYRSNEKSRKHQVIDESCQQLESIESDSQEAAEEDFQSPAEHFLARIESLPEIQQRALTLKYVFGLSCVEVAEREGCCAGTVKTRLFYARRSLAKTLDPALSVSHQRNGAMRADGFAGHAGRQAA